MEETETIEQIAAELSPEVERAHIPWRTTEAWFRAFRDKAMEVTLPKLKCLEDESVVE